MSFWCKTQYPSEPSETLESKSLKHIQETQMLQKSKHQSSMHVCLSSSCFFFSFSPLSNCLFLSDMLWTSNAMQTAKPLCTGADSSSNQLYFLCSGDVEMEVVKVATAPCQLVSELPAVWSQLHLVFHTERFRHDARQRLPAFTTNRRFTFYSLIKLTQEISISQIKFFIILVIGN